ncbi:MAG: sigma-70 family RNA polymerase sigma factor [Planctomycetes bacterium]|nr:sigma-70 family RNA polymerase sigma factor [Planctomycetota bacterium]
MDTTRASLLLRLRDRADADAWALFDRIYRPMLTRFAMRMGLGREDADDVVQQCLKAVAQHIGSFEYDPARGRFKGWLRTLVQNKVLNELRIRRPVAAESGMLRSIQADEENPADAFERIWMQEHLWHCLKELRSEVEGTTYRAFEEYVLNQRAAEEVAKELGLSVNHVYTIKWRLTEKVAAKMKDLLDGDC